MFVVGAPALLLPECETTSLGWAWLSALEQHVWMWRVRAIRTSGAPTSQDCLRTWVGSCFVNSYWEKWRGRASEDWVWRVGGGRDCSNYQVMRIPLSPPSCAVQGERWDNLCYEGYAGLCVWDIHPRLHDFSQELSPARLVSSSPKPNSELYVANVFKFICSDSV